MSTIHCPVSDAAAISRHETAIVSGDHVMLYFDLDEMAARVARNLRLAGCAPGTRVGLFLETSWQSVAILFGCLRAGVVACPLNTRLPREAVLDQLRQISTRRLVARTRAESAPALAEIQIIAPDELLIYREPDDDEAPHWLLRLDAPATILFTSGSSGRPKAVELTVANHYYSARGSNQNLRLASRDCWLLTLPLYHVGGLGILFRCALAGAAIAIPEPDESIARAQERYGATHLSVVPTQLYRLANAESMPDSFSRVKAILLGGSPVPPALMVEALRRKWPVYPSYGLTEMGSQVCTMAPSSPPAKRMTSGRVLAHRELRIAADGEILVRGQTLFNGYVSGSSLDPSRDGQGWFPTGDLGELDAEGYLTVKGRKDNLFISGGENIQPEEIEQWLGSMPEVSDVIVAPLPDREFGARPVAFIRWNGDAVPDAELRTRLERVLPRYKIPIQFRPWPSGEESLKTSRRYFRALLEEGA